MTPESWIKSNYAINDEYNAIDWGNGVFTPMSTFLNMFGEIIQTALDDNVDPKKAIRNSDPENKKGYNNLL